MNFLRWRDRLLLLVLALLPWQARLIRSTGELNGYPWEQGTVSLFAIEALIWSTLSLHLLAIAKVKAAPRPTPPPALLLWALLLAYALVSVFWSGQVVPALLAWLRLFDGFALAYLLWVSELPIRTCLKAFLWSAAAAAAFGITQFFSQAAGSSTLFGMAAHDPAAAGTSVVETERARFLRAYGPLPHPNVLGGYLATALVAATGLLVEAATARTRRIFLAIAAVLVVGLLVTFSRSAWLAAAAALGIAVIFGRAAPDPEIRPRLRSAVLVLALTSFAFLVALWPVVAPRVTANGRLESRSLDERVIALGQAGELFRRHAVSGVGVGQMAPAAYAELPYAGHRFAYQPAHFLPALLGAELGFFGLMAGLAFVAAWLYEACAAFRAATQPLSQFALALPLVILVTGLFDHYAATQLAGTLLAGFCFGLAFKAQGGVMASKPD